MSHTSVVPSEHKENIVEAQTLDEILALVQDYVFWRDDDVAILCGDCLEIMSALPARPSLDVVIMDPPYSSGARRDADKAVRGAMLRSMEDEDWFTRDNLTSLSFLLFMRLVAATSLQLLVLGGSLYSFCDWRQLATLIMALESAGLRVNNTLVWDKEHYGMGQYWRNQHEMIVFASKGTPQDFQRHDCGNVLHQKAVSPATRIHPTEKPIELISALLSPHRGLIVLDPFMGSGSTLAACKLSGKVGIGIEIEEKYCELAKQRLQQRVLITI